MAAVAVAELLQLTLYTALVALAAGAMGAILLMLEPQGQPILAAAGAAVVMA